ncbi:MAG: alpha/beta hydrolase [Candidatus Electryoneaceae bacterium]|nr:alpha/beta hydrolase [Candidatus Electryoneaceae bacterium]
MKHFPLGWMVVSVGVRWDVIDRHYDPNRLEQHKIGSGDPPILLLHGWGGNFRSLDGVGTALSQYRKIWAVSLPGFGKSPEPPGRWRTWDYVELVKDWMERNSLPNVDIIAHSFGGRVAIGLAARYPRLVGRLVLIAAAGLIPPRSPRTRIKLFLARTAKKTGKKIGGPVERWLEKRRQRFGSTDWQNASPMMRAVMGRILSEDMADELPKIVAPTLLVWGSDDTATPPVLAYQMEKLIPDVQLTMLDGAGHFSFLDRRGDVVSLIWKHLQLPTVW